MRPSHLALVAIALLIAYVFPYLVSRLTFSLAGLTVTWAPLALLLLVILYALFSYALSRSLTTSLLFFLVLTTSFDVLDGLNPSEFFASYFPPYLGAAFFAFVVEAFLTKGVSDPAVESLKLKRLTWRPAVPAALSTLTVYLLTHDPFLVLGSVLAGLLSTLNDAWYWGFTALASWLVVPALYDAPYTRLSEGVCLGKLEAELAPSLFSSGQLSSGWRKARGEFCVDFSRSHNYNLVIVGSSGAGKSSLARALLRGLRDVNYLVVDPHGEHSDLGERIDASKVSLNPLSLLGSSPHSRSVEIASMIKSVFGLGPLQEITLVNLLVEAYALKGITDDPTTWSYDPPTFSEVLAVLEREKKLASDAQTLSRLSSVEPYLKFLNEAIFPGKGVKLEDLFEGRKVLDVSSVPMREVAYMIIETVLRASLYYLREKKGRLTNLIVVDEAPFVLEKESGSAILTKLASEGRKFGLGVVLISQQMDPVKDVIPNTSYQMVLRLTNPEDARYAASLLSGGDERLAKALITALTSLNRGEVIARDFLTGRVVRFSLPPG